MLLRANERNGMITIISGRAAADSPGLVAMERLLLSSDRGGSRSAINKGPGNGSPSPAGGASKCAPNAGASETASPNGVSAELQLLQLLQVFGERPFSQSAGAASTGMRGSQVTGVSFTSGRPSPHELAPVVSAPSPPGQRLWTVILRLRSVTKIFFVQIKMF